MVVIRLYFSSSVLVSRFTARDSQYPSRILAILCVFRHPPRAADPSNATTPAPNSPAPSLGSYVLFGAPRKKEHTDTKRRESPPGRAHAVGRETRVRQGSRIFGRQPSKWRGFPARDHRGGLPRGIFYATRADTARGVEKHAPEIPSAPGYRAGGGVTGRDWSTTQLL